VCRPLVGPRLFGSKYVHVFFEMNLVDVVPVRMAMAWGSRCFWCFSVGRAVA
jgi:hypothetical protein